MEEKPVSSGEEILKKVKSNEAKKSGKTRFNEKEIEKQTATVKQLTKKKEKKKVNKNQKTKQSKKEKKNEKPEKRKMAKRSITEIIPIIDMDDDGLIELKDNQGFYDIWQLQSKDVYSMNDEETRFDIYNLSHFYQAYHNSIKFLAINFPVNTTKQQQFIQKKIDKCKSTLYEKFLIQKMTELQFLEWGRTNREYFVFIFGENQHIVNERVQSVKRYLQRIAPISPIDENKKIEILYKLNNQNSKLGNKLS
ncbi:hypothetical protein [Metabacillus fastidiosus]|uniref:hypothetical protein n=1 Tax=Metabacillus fastidiosus TaxID=1458 RepID=UPI003D2A53CD